MQSLTSVDWIFWETMYSGSFAFLFFINSITMTYSSIRWQYTAWWLGTAVCIIGFGTGFSHRSHSSGTITASISEVPSQSRRSRHPSNRPNDNSTF
ncbi:hypothetical protein COOONC_23320 [Cooperia oncophora]